MSYDNSRMKIINIVAKIKFVFQRISDSDDCDLKLCIFFNIVLFS